GRLDWETVVWLEAPFGSSKNDRIERPGSRTFPQVSSVRRAQRVMDGYQMSRESPHSHNNVSKPGAFNHHLACCASPPQTRLFWTLLSQASPRV
ncbi:hypothetical protein CRM22_011375, partial [Opisthorchis felineus]